MSDLINSPLISIVVCTYNRKEYLKKCLDSLIVQTYLNYEIVVVLTPSNDSSEQVLLEYPQIKKVVLNPKPHLCISRNLGIQNASGEIVAFIDDDAIAEPDWLTQLIAGYTDETIGGVGGFVKTEDKTKFQLRSGYVDLFGTYFADPNIDRFSVLVGGNCSFRRTALVAIGGFDEYYNFFYDDFDISIRLIKAGYQIVLVEKAIVYHALADGINRRNWFDDIKNRIYFIRQNSAEPYDEQTLLCMSHILRDKYKNVLNNEYTQKKLSTEEYNQYTQDCISGAKAALNDAEQKIRHLNYKL